MDNVHGEEDIQMHPPTQEPATQNQASVKYLVETCHVDLYNDENGVLTPETVSRVSTEEIKSYVLQMRDELAHAVDQTRPGLIRNIAAYFGLPDLATDNEEMLRNHFIDVQEGAVDRKLTLMRLSELICFKLPEGDTLRKKLKNMVVRMYEKVHRIHHAVLSHISCVAVGNDKVAELPPRDDHMGFSWPVSAKASPVQMLIVHMLSSLHSKSYRRGPDGIYKEILTVNNHHTHAWEQVDTIKNFLYQEAKKETNNAQWKWLTSGPAVAKQVEEYLTVCRDREFPDLEFRRDYISFSNGIYHTASNTFYSYEGSPHTSKLDPNVVSLKYLDEEFDPSFATREDWRLIPTPALDSIFRSQAYEDDTLHWAMAMLGRLLYEVGELDNWQVGMFIKGIAGSGKSTLSDVVKKIFPRHQTGTMSGSKTHEKKFGLASIYDKMIFFCTEVKRDFMLDQGDWQSIVSGEDVSVAIKFETAKSVRWKVPGLMCGNELPRWVDASGSVVRRLVMFEFMHKVMVSNPMLPEQLNKEIAAFVCKTNRAYLEMVDRFGKKDIWSPGVLSRQLHDWHDQLKRDVDAMTAFFDNGGRIQLDSQSYMRESDLKSMYESYCKDFGVVSGGKWDADHCESIFSELGLVRSEKETREWPPGSGKALKAIYVDGLRPVM